MSLGLLVTALVALYTASSPTAMQVIFGNRLLFYGLLIGELLMVGYLSVRVAKLSAATATTIFMAYSALNGVTLSAIFWVYTTESISSTFFVTAGTFGAMSAYGYVTRRDLSGLGSFCLMGLIGLIIASLVNLFLGSAMIYWITTYVGIIVFVGLTAYDTQKIKNLSTGHAGSEEDRKGAIMGALALYLDFINLFLMLLRLFGRRR
jgi:FtsH-binding integral membrane protein